MLLLSAAANHNARDVTLVLPSYFYGRVDRPTSNRPVSSASLLRDLYTTCVGRRNFQILTIDLHNEAAIGNGFRWVNLYASHILVPRMQVLFDISNTIFIAADQGAAPRTHKYYQLAGGFLPIMQLIKSRDLSTDNVKVTGIVGDPRLLADRDVVIIDDIIATGGTFVSGVEFLQEFNPASVNGAITHSFLSPEALSAIAASGVRKILVTDTIPAKPGVVNNGCLEVISVAPLLAEAINRLAQNLSLDDLFLDSPST
jgi:ribose-phosphate pyrophosphokinase